MSRRGVGLFDIVKLWNAALGGGICENEPNESKSGRQNKPNGHFSQNKPNGQSWQNKPNAAAGVRENEPSRA
jgi:hypothetical protein